MGAVTIPYPKNYALRDAIYELISKGFIQREIPDKLRQNGITVKKSRVSQIIKELGQEEYVRCNMRTVYKSYVITKKPYPYISKSLQSSRWDRKKEFRIHNQTFKYRIIEKSVLTNDPKRWDEVIKMRGGVTQYLYSGHDALGRDLTVQRMEGKAKDTLVIRIADMNWDYDKLDAFDEFIIEKRVRAEYGIMHHFKMQMEFIGRTKTSYAIRPAPYPELQQAFQSDNYAVGDLEGDSSIADTPELETENRAKAVGIMEFLNLADSGRLPELFDVLKRIKDVHIPLETIIDVIKKKSEQDSLYDMENHERGVIG